MDEDTCNIYIYIYIWFIIRDNVTYEGFRVLDYLLQECSKALVVL